MNIAWWHRLSAPTGSESARRLGGLSPGMPVLCAQESVGRLPHCGIIWVTFGHLGPSGHIMPDHAGDQGEGQSSHSTALGTSNVMVCDNFRGVTGRSQGIIRYFDPSPVQVIEAQLFWPWRLVIAG